MGGRGYWGGSGFKGSGFKGLGEGIQHKAGHEIPRQARDDRGGRGKDEGGENLKPEIGRFKGSGFKGLGQGSGDPSTGSG